MREDIPKTRFKVGDLVWYLRSEWEPPTADHGVIFDIRWSTRNRLGDPQIPQVWIHWHDGAHFWVEPHEIDFL